MSLHFITGEKKTGKTTMVLEQMQMHLQQNKTVIYIVPEQMVFRAETYILDRLGEQQAYLVDTLSFSKLADSLLKKRADRNLLQLLDSCSKKLILHKVLQGLKDELAVYGNVAGSSRMLALLSESITELKKYCVDDTQLAELLQKEQLSDNLKRKLGDLKKILNGYEQEIDRVYRDYDDVLTLACEEVKKGALQNAEVYIDGFIRFTTQEMQMIESLLGTGNHVTVTMMMTPQEESFYGKRFYTTYLTRQKLREIAEGIPVPVTETALTEKKSGHTDLNFLAEQFLAEDAKTFGEKPLHLRIREYSDVQQECDDIAADILKGAAEKQIRFGETAVILPDPEGYRPYLTRALESRGISYYLDGREAIVRLPIVRLIAHVLGVCLRRNDRQAYLLYLKSGFFYPQEYDKILQFENAILENGIKGYELAELSRFQQALERAKLWGKLENDAGVLEVFQTVLEPLNQLAVQMNRKGTAAEKSIQLYRFMEQTGIPELIQKTADRQNREGDAVGAMQTTQAYNAICHALEKTALVLGDEVICASAYQEILNEAIREETVATVPLGFDSVMITGLRRLKSNEYKAVYFAGLNEGKIPGSHKTEGLINETDREELVRNGFSLLKENQLKIVDEYTEIYEILGSPREQLVLSYPLADAKGEPQRPSMIIGEARAMFPQLGVETPVRSLQHMPKEALFDYGAQMLCEQQNGGYLSVFLQDEEYRKAAKAAFDHYFHKKEEETVDGKLVRQLYPHKLETSVSRLEKYRSCHFAYFMDYMLKARDVEELKPDPLSMGSMLHSVLELFCRIAKKTEYSDMNEEFIRKEVDRIIERLLKDPKNSVYTLNRQNAYAVKKLKRVAVRTLMNIKHHFEKSVFTPIGFELSFGKDGGELAGITLQLANGREVSLNGVIDRADRAQEFVRVVDYKSSARELSVNDIYHGISLQLAVYLATLLRQNPDYRPGSMTYLAADDPIVTIRSMGDVHRVEDEIRSRFMMKGLLLKDKTVLSMMDRELEKTGRSQIVDAGFKKDGDILATKEKNMLTLGEFQLILQRAVDMAQILCEDIYRGKTDAKPVKCGDTDGCRYCSYQHFCGFDPDRDRPEELPKLDKDEVFAHLRDTKKGGEDA